MSTIAFQHRRSLTEAQLQQAINYIHTHLDRDLSLEQIAAAIYISSNYFASLFKSATGISPRQYVIRQRVKRAKMLLLKTDLAIADIASQVGFSSQSHLTQQFKRFSGVSPHQYVIQQRVKRAKMLLLKTDLAIVDIALQVGFSSQSHLTRQFKRFTGMTPKQVR